MTGASDPGRAMGVVLAGGRGTRLRQVWYERPKCLVPVRGRAVLDWQLEWLAQEGIRHAILATGWRGDEVEAHLRARTVADVAASVTRDGPSPAGTGGAARRALAGVTSTWAVVLNGDTAL